MARQRYTPELQAEVIETARHFGPAEASRLHGVPKGTIGAWCSRAGVATVASERTAHATEAHRATMEHRRSDLAERLIKIADQCAERAEDVIAKASLRDVVGAWDYAIKNSQLLSGQATARTETSDTRTAAEGTLDELAKRRATKAA